MNREGKLEKVVVAVKASKEIPKTALVWALTHVVQPGHCIMLLVVGPSQTAGRRMWGFPRFSGDCASVHQKSNSGASPEQKVDITASCSQMILQLNNVYDPNKVNVKIKVVSGSPCGVVAAEAKKFHASWVVLDKKLKHEQKSCMEELQCNVVIMKKSQPKVLRLNLLRSPTKVGDFGLARWQPDGGTGEATRVIGTFGYLAPEYAESGQITEKADVYSFGVVLVELVSGRKAVDLNRPKGQQCLTEWARPLLQEDAIDELIDPRLGDCYSEHEVRCMLQAAYLCIKRDPHLRPRMSQVLRILEGDVMMESSHVSTTPGREVGKGSWINQPQHKSSHLSNTSSGKLCVDSTKPTSNWVGDKR